VARWPGQVNETPVVGVEPQYKWSGRRDLNPGPLAPQTRDRLLWAPWMWVLSMAYKDSGRLLPLTAEAAESILSTLLRTLECVFAPSDAELAAVLYCDIDSGIRVTGVFYRSASTRDQISKAPSCPVGR
jgi:hypothetical protein